VPGYAFKSNDWQTDGIPVVKIKNITGSNSVDLATTDCVPESLLTPKLQKFVIKDGDILVAMTGATAGKVGRVRTHRPVLLNQRVAKIAPTEADPDFIWAVVSSQEYQEKFFYLADGAAQPNMSGGQIEGVEIPLPPLPIQQRIAGILSAYDELIENSQRRIKTLESMARALYREWFVHFRFPGHKSAPRIASPLGEIPQGWEVATFGELYNTSSGGTPSRKKPEYFKDGNTDWVKSQELLDDFILSTEERITDAALKNSSAKVFPANTVLIALYGATIGKLGILAREAATNQACCAVLPKDPMFGREFAFLTLIQNRERIIGLRLGAAQQNISQVLLRNLECIKPPGKLVSAFAERTSPLLDGILILQRQIKNLRRTRDLLLPRLLSGQIDLESLG
jgi:type I restriction enzyme S subunit